MMPLFDIGDSAQLALDRFFAWLPALIGAVIILVIGWFIARLVGGLVRRGLRAAGADRALAQGRAGEYKQSLAPGLNVSSLVGTIAFWFVFGSAILLAVSALGIDALTEAISGVVAYLPNVIAAILILLVAIALAGAVGGLAQRLLGGTMLGRIVQTAVPALIVTIALFMALVQLKIATEIVVATYVLVLGAIALGFALAFGLGGRDVAGRVLEGAYASGEAAMPQLRQEAQQAREQASTEAQRLVQDTQAGGSDGRETTGARLRPASGL